MVACTNFIIIPSVSTIGNFFTIAFLLAILITPRARVTVTTIGRPSGIAATAKLTIYKSYIYSETCLNQTYLGPTFVFRIDR